MAPSPPRVLLPADIVPTEYRLRLEPDLDAFTFAGHVAISVDVAVATRKVVLHAKQLAIHEARAVIAGGATTLVAQTVDLDAKEMTLTLGFAEELPCGPAVMEVAYSGVLNDELSGFYRSRYTRADGTPGHLAVTMFAPIDARKCFPCWDEPARKAVFRVTVVHDARLTAISNMPELARKQLAGEDGERVAVEFEPTPKMSTYILAVCVGEFEAIETMSANGATLVRCLAVPGKARELSWALDVGVRSLDFYNEFFGIPYPLPKLDMVAIPDFSCGAMENWGLITYKEIDMLLDPATASAPRKQRVGTVVPHEIAHQWFGNLVTMAWWDDLWLNEGFANWMQNFTADALFPDWRMWENFIAAEQAAALSLDGLRTSHPVKVPIERAEMVEEVFDEISYFKGGSVVRMVFRLLGERAFREGLTAYLSDHSHGNTTSDDLWRHWEDASKASGAHVPVKAIMDTWTLQEGYPLLTVHGAVERDGKTVFDVEQSWFIADGSARTGDAARRWVVPIITGGAAGVHEAVQYLREGRGAITVGGTDWVRFNYGQHVPMRVAYTAGLLEDLRGALPTWSAEDRIGFLSDTTALMTAGHLPQADAIRTAAALRHDRNDKVWKLLATFCGLWPRALANARGHPAVDPPALSASIARFVQWMVSPVLAEVSFDVAPTDTDNTRRLRQICVALLAGSCGTAGASVAREFTDTALERFDAFVADPGVRVLNTDIRAAVLATAVRARGGAAVAALRAVHDGGHAAVDAAMKVDIYMAMGAAGDAAVLRGVLEWAVDGSIRSMDIIHVVRGVVANIDVATGTPVGGLVLTKFLDERYADVDRLLGTSSMMLYRHIVRAAFDGVDSRTTLTATACFWRGKDLVMLAKSITQCVEACAARLDTAERFAGSELAVAGFWDSLVAAEA